VPPVPESLSFILTSAPLHERRSKEPSPRAIQGSIAGFKIIYRDENGVWDGVRWDGQHPSFFANR
jgi:hypothetical protein